MGRPNPGTDLGFRCGARERYTVPVMVGKIPAKTPEEYIARVEDRRREDVRRLHDLVRVTAPESAGASWGM
jgi:hypothetical protein